MRKPPTKIVRMVAVYCPNRFKLHKNTEVYGLYVRYALLFDSENQCVGWLDDPNEVDLRGIIFDSSITGEWVAGDCPFCKAHASAS